MLRHVFYLHQRTVIAELISSVGADVIFLSPILSRFKPDKHHGLSIKQHIRKIANYLADFFEAVADSLSVS